jgi:hypothetical protein
MKIRRVVARWRVAQSDRNPAAAVDGARSRRDCDPGPPLRDLEFQGGISIPPYGRWGGARSSASCDAFCVEAKRVVPSQCMLF